MSDHVNPTSQAPIAAGQPPPSAPSRQEVWIGRAREYVRRGSEATGLDPLTFVPVAGGIAGLALLLLMTLLSWEFYQQTMDVVGTRIVEGEWYRGISYPEGKWIFIGGLAAGVWIVLGIAKRSWLPGGLHAAGAVATFAVVVMLALRWRLATAFAQVQAQMEQVEDFMATNPMGQYAGQAMQEAGSTMPVLRGGPTWALAFAIPLAIAIAAAFLLASLRQPQSIAYFQKPGTPPLIQKYGAVGAAYAAAFLFGLIFAVIRH